MPTFKWSETSGAGFVAQELSQVMKSWVTQTQNQVETDLSVKDTYEGNSSNIVFNAGASEMMRITETGFWVRGVQVEQDAREAAIVYNNFKQWLTWAQLNKE